MLTSGNFSVDDLNHQLPYLGSDFDLNGTDSPAALNFSEYQNSSADPSPPLTYPNVDFASVAKRELRWALILHDYGFGCLFFVLAFYTFFSVLNLRSLISSRPFMSTINGFLCLLGVSRSASLLIDPYGFKESMPRIFGQILWDLGYPGIISAFCLVQLAFLQLTQLKLGPEILRRKSYLSLVITAHFLLTVSMDILVAVHEDLVLVKYIIQYVFLSWGIVLCCTFLYSGYKVMLLIRKIPGGLQRDVPDPNHKGIMQLAMLAPYNNLAGSVTAALLPTLCAPKIHQQDIATSSLGFRNDPNSRILESESIPILEEVAGSSGDERSPLPSTRAASLQNQANRKPNLKPKLSLQNGEEEPPKSPKSKKCIESFVTTKDINEFRTKIQTRTSFENENFRIKKEDLLVPDIMVSCPSGRNSSEDIKQEPGPSDALNEVISQIEQDLKEMNIERDSEERRSRKGISRKSERRNGRRDSHRLSVDQSTSRRSSGCSDVSDVDEGKERRKQKSLSWRKKDIEPYSNDCLLQQEAPAGDVSLTAILNHIAFVNRANMSSDSGSNMDVDKARRSEMEWVLNVTYITAMWGLMLCLTTMSQVQATAIIGQGEQRGTTGHSLLTSPWPWLWFQTFCRALELAMGCAMANITRQPTAHSRYPHTLRLRHRDTFQ